MHLEQPVSELQAEISALVGFPVYVARDCDGVMIYVTDDGCYGPGGAEGDLVLAQRIESALARPGVMVVACGVVAWDPE